MKGRVESRVPLGRILFPLLACCLVLTACIQNRGVLSPEELVVLRDGAPPLPAQEDVTGVVYVSLRDGNNRIFGLRAQLEKCLVSKGYAVTQNPSKAGYIVQLSVPSAGQSSRDAAEAAVKNGYAGDHRLSGTEGTALIADALVVQRRVPQHGKKSLKNISTRRAVADKQMRLALYSPRKFNFQQSLPDAVTERIAGEICSGLGQNAATQR
ncbi:MAG: complement resistance protein TraT [Desulfovibrio sp.]|jgi:hypothetical protein|nr:complement resistance protein TraT [Desulfovibrio sp.]